MAAAQTTQSYTDSTGEISGTIGNHPHLDITSVDVTLDVSALTLTFRIHLNGDPAATNWGKYMVGIRSGDGGATTGNGWGRPIDFTPGMTHWIGAWIEYVANRRASVVVLRRLVVHHLGREQRHRGGNA